MNPVSLLHGRHYTRAPWGHRRPSADRPMPIHIRRTARMIPRDPSPHYQGAGGEWNYQPGRLMRAPGLADAPAAQASGGFFSSLFSEVVKPGLNVYLTGVANNLLLKQKQKEAELQYGPNAVKARLQTLHGERQLVSAERDLAAERAMPVIPHSEPMSTKTMLIVGGVVVGGIVLLTMLTKKS